MKASLLNKQLMPTSQTRGPIELNASALINTGHSQLAKRTEETPKMLIQTPIQKPRKRLGMSFKQFVAKSVGVLEADEIPYGEVKKVSA
jgi:hypothetical protein